jgi:hypothetical protein
VRTAHQRRAGRQPFSGFTGGTKAHEELLEKVLGGTGILPVRRTGWKPVLLNLNFWFFQQDLALIRLI